MHWEVTLMTDNKKVPRLRFKEFTDAWEQRKLNDEYQKIGNAFVGTASPYYVENGHFYLESNNIKNGQINHDHEIFINDSFFKKQADKYLHTGDLVMVQSGHVGDTAVITKKYNNTAAHALIMFRNPKHDATSTFLNYYFQSDNAKSKISVLSIGNTISHILASDMSRFTVSFPKNVEQEKITKLFSSLQNLITLHQRKLNLLNQLKKGMLQKLFAGKNQKQPNLRFKGFADTWKKETLKEVSQWSKGQGLPKKDLNTYEKGKEVIHYADLYKLGPVIKGVIHWSTSKEGRKIPTNSIIFPMSDVTPTGLARTSAVVKDGILAGGDVLIDNLSSKIQSKFLSYEINANSHQILSLVTGTTVKHINSKSLNRLSITYPNMQEQEMISNTLENIFTQIEFYRYRISKLQQLKKSLLQNMFI